MMSRSLGRCTCWNCLSFSSYRSSADSPILTSFYSSEILFPQRNPVSFDSFASMLQVTESARLGVFTLIEKQIRTKLALDLVRVGLIPL